MIEQFTDEVRKDPIEFADKILGIQLHPGQIRWIRNADKLINLLRPGNRFGKAIKIDTPLYTPLGLRLAKDIKVGDELYGQDGKPTKVTGVFPQGTRQTYKMTFNDGRNVIVDENHLWECQTATNRFRKDYNEFGHKYENREYQKWSVINTREIIDRWGLNPRPKNRITIPACEPVEFEGRDIPVDAYQLGLLIGNGCFVGGIRYTTIDLETLETFDYKKGCGKYDYYIHGLVGKIRELGLMGHRSYEKFIPKDYLFNSIENRKAILAGLLDTDGTIQKNGQIEYSTSSEQLMKDIKFLVHSLGGQCKVSSRIPWFTHKGIRKQGRKSYRVYIKTSFNPFKLKRKFDRQTVKFTTLNPILYKIEDMGQQETVCFSVDNERKLFLVGDFLVTHNSLSEAIMHAWHATTKPGLFGKARNETEWMTIEYPTLVFGPEYEQSRELLRLMVDIVEGNLLIPVCPFCDSHRIHKENAKDKVFDCVDCKQTFIEPEHRVNQSMLKGWAIDKDNSNTQLMPMVVWFNNSKTLARSYDEMGKAFKMKALAYITGDECSDIQELYTFTTNTLLPRLINFKGIIHFVGTPQPDGFDYQRMIEMAEEAMQRPNPNMYTQKGSVYENIFVDAAYVQQIEDVADPELRRQIIDGEFVQLGDKYFGFDRIRNMIDTSIVMLKEGYMGRNYLVSVDFAYGSSVWADYTVVMVFDYTEEPWKVVYFDRFKAKEVPVPVQYKMVKEIVDNFRARLIIDSSGPGGKNALAFLKEMHPIAFEAGPTGPTSSKKQEGLASLKAALDGAGNTELSRVVRVNPDGTREDLKKVWGSIRTPNIPELISEMSNYKLDDKRLRTDCVMALMMAVDWLMMRRPKQARNKAVDIDFLDARIDDTPFKEGYFPYGRHKGAVSY